MYPPRVFNSKSLQDLKLESGLLVKAWASEGYENLKTLVFKNMVLSDQELADIICNCINLKRLSLLQCFNLQQPKNHSPNLKYLELRQLGMIDIKIKDEILTNLVVINVDCSYGMSIDTPNLKSLEMKDSSAREIDINAPSLENLVIDNADCSKGINIQTPNLKSYHTCQIIEVESHGSNKKRKAICTNERMVRKLCKTSTEILAKVSSLYEGSNGPHKHKTCMIPFQYLSKLFIHGNLNDVRQAIVVSFMLKICIRLHELNITIGQQFVSDSKHACLPYATSKFWRMRDSFDPIGYYLKKVSIRGFSGKKLELEFVRFLIARACALQTMTIQCCNNCSKEGAEAIEDLLALPMASLFHMVLEPGPTYSSKVQSDFKTWVSTLQ